MMKNNTDKHRKLPCNRLLEDYVTATPILSTSISPKVLLGRVKVTKAT